jgi:hypothetical protein
MGTRLTEANGVAKAADACVEAGSADKGLEIALDIKQLVYEGNRLSRSCGYQGFHRIWAGAGVQFALAS